MPCASPGGQPASGNHERRVGECVLGAGPDQEVLRAEAQGGEEEQPGLRHLCHERRLQGCCGEHYLPLYYSFHNLYLIFELFNLIYELFDPISPYRREMTSNSMETP